MICQVKPIPSEPSTQASSAAIYGQQFATIRVIERRQTEGFLPESPAANNLNYWSPFTAGTYVVPITRWIE
jgi:hypothetical protein